jgi:UPF0755 protein
MQKTTTTRPSNSQAQRRNKIWLRGGALRHFARLLGYLLLVPVSLVVLALSALMYAVIWLSHAIRAWLRSHKPLSELLSLLLLSLTALLALTVYGPFSPRWTGSQETVVVVERGLSVREIAARLARENVLPSAGQFLFLSKLFGVEDQLQAGRYSFASSTPPLEILRRLSQGGVSSQMVTIPEGMTIQEMAQLLERESGIDPYLFFELAHDPQVLKEHDIDASSLEGYLFPDTYGLYWAMPARKVIDILVSRFRQLYDLNMASRAQELGMSLHQVVTLASMIEEEAMIDEERPIIAAVYHNRLRRKMLLQCDPTVIYALGGKRTPLTRQDLQVDSPYNTYRHHGLPPGPISSPGRASILAALQPADVDYLYFVARGDGSHHFSRTSREHINAIHHIRKNLGG